MNIVESDLPPVVEENGYIQHKVDFICSLSEDNSDNSWDEESSDFSEANDYYDEEEEESPATEQPIMK